MNHLDALRRNLDKIKSNEKITLVEDEKMFTQDIKVAEELNSFFSSVVKDLKIPEYSETNLLAEEIANRILKPVLKYDKHLRSHFEFFFVSVDEVLKEIKKLNPAWKVSKYGVISGPYFPVFGLNTEIYGVNPYLDTFHAV